MRKVFTFWLLAVLVSAPSLQADARRPGLRPVPAPARAVRVPPLYAGFRSSRYGISPFPNPLYWALVGKSMANRFPEGRPGGVWLVGVVEDDSGCRLNFPSPGGSFAHVYFTAVDQNEEFLRFFDAAGVSVWLQVEPGEADVSTLIDLVLRRYGSHACLRGIGVDVEWLAWRDHRFGRAVTDSEALAWSARVASYNSAYSLFLKHWMVERMPPHYRGTILFVDDSQELPSLAVMVEEFHAWEGPFLPIRSRSSSAMKRIKPGGGSSSTRRETSARPCSAPSRTSRACFGSISLSGMFFRRAASRSFSPGPTAAETFGQDNYMSLAWLGYNKGSFMKKEFNR